MSTTVEGMRLTRKGVPEALFWAPYTEGIMLVEGLQGAGKSLFLTTMGWKFKKLFDKPICMDYHPKDAFGEHKYIGEEELLAELEAVSIAAKTQKEGRAKGEALIQKWIESGPGSYLQGSALLLQEGYRYFDRRRPMDKLGILYGYLVQQWRHYGMLIAVEATRVQLLDDYRFIPYINYWVKCGWIGNNHTAVYQIENRHYPPDHPERNKGLTIDAEHWGQLYDSWMPIAMRKKWFKGAL